MKNGIISHRPTQTYTDFRGNKKKNNNDRQLKAKIQLPIKVKYKCRIVGEYFADIVVENSIILELKAVESLHKIQEAQLLNYLKATDYKIGLLINFTYPKAEIKRFVF